jgi:ABC-type multidrug transport system fused ATPase/permease subunit
MEATGPPLDEGRSMKPELGLWRGQGDDDAERTAAEAPEHRARLRRRSRALLGSLLRPYRPSLALAAGLLLAQNVAAMAGPYLVMLGIDRGIRPLKERGDPRVLVAVAAAFAVAAVTEYVGKRGFLTLSGRIGQAVLLDLRTRVYDKFQGLSVDFHEGYTSGRMVARLTSDMDAISELADGGLDDLVLAGVSMVSVAGVLLWLDAPLAAVTLLTFPFLLGLTRWFATESARAYRRTRETVALVIIHFVESIGGVRAVQAFRRERRNQEIFDAVNDDYRRANLRAFRLIAAYSPGLKLAGNVAVAVVLGFGGWRVMQGHMGLGVLAAFLLYLRRFFEPMQDLSQFYNALQSATAALEKLAGVLDEKPSVPEPAAPARRSGREPAGRGAIRLCGLSFGYRRDTPVLTDFELAIPAGQTVALVGATGAGKSTVAKLVARFYDPDAGAVSLDGVDLRQIPDEELRRAVVMVTQENFLFSGTVADNIRFGRPEVDDDRVAEAAAAIGAAEFVAELPDGFATEVTKRGGRLSAGQRQLIAFARAFLADPAVLILDEATSSLDIPSERLVQRALRTILADRTALVIAHRLSTVQIADRVLVLDAGRVVEDGPPERLIAAGGRYAALHRQWLDSLM